MTITATGGSCTAGRAKGANTAITNHFHNTEVEARSPDQLSKTITAIAMQLSDTCPGANDLSTLVPLPQ